MKWLRPGGLLSLVLAIALIVGVFGVGVTTEIPVASVSGVVKFKKSGKIAKNASVALYSNSVAENNLEVVSESRMVRTDENGRFFVRNLPAGVYSASSSTRTAASEEVTVTLTGGQKAELNIDLSPLPTDFTVSCPQRVFLPKEEVFMNVSGVSSKDAAQVDVFKIDDKTLQQEKRFQDILSSFANGKIKGNNPAQGLTSVQKFELKLDERDEEGAFFQDLKIKGLAEGIYWVQVEVQGGTGAATRGTYVAISQIGLIAKAGVRKSLAQVVDLESGQPVAGAEIRTLKNKVTAPVGKTDVEGLLEAARIPNTSDVFLYARQGKSFAFIAGYAAKSDSPTRVVSHFVFDRTIYRPGDEVNYKGILRQVAGTRYVLPPNGTVQVTIEDTNGTKIETKQFPLSPSGAFSGKFATLSNQVGTYSINATYNGSSFYDSVEVAAYRKPEYKISVTPIKPRFSRGETMQVEVECEYYFGGPVVGADVSGSVYRASYWAYDNEEYDGEEMYDWVGDYVGSIDSAKTDENGKVIISYPASKILEQEKGVDNFLGDQKVTFEVSVNEGDDKYFDGKGTALLTQGEVSLNIDSEIWVAKPKERVPFTAVVENFDGKPVANASVEFETGYYEWENNNGKFVQIGKNSVTTNANGEAILEIEIPDTSSVLIRARTKDSQGNEILDERDIWVSTDSWSQRPGAKLEVRLDKKSYKVGDEAMVLVTTSEPGGIALLTVEAEDVLYKKVITLDRNSINVSIPVAENMFPNARVAVARIRKKTLSTAESGIRIEAPDKKLTIAVTSDKPKYLPGETANYKVAVTDAAGKPVVTDLALGLVDEGIFAIREDRSDPYKTLYPKRWSQVETLYSFPEVYLDGGDKASKMTQVRRDFKDTAAWVPSVMTDANGQASVSLKLPDNLTSWRMTATTVSANGQCGKSKQNVTASKPLMVRLSMPTRLLIGDKVELTALVTNDSGGALSPKLDIQSEGLEQEGLKAQEFALADGETKAIKWFASASKSGDYKILATVNAGSVSDAVEMTLPVQPQGQELVRSEVRVFSEPELSFELKRQAETTRGEVSIVATSDPVALVAGSLESLVDYPYGCVEQTMSRFTPAVVVAKVLKDRGQSLGDLESKIPKVVADSYQRLRTLQLSSGAFGWFEHSSENPDMTALVLDGFDKAARAGYPAPTELLNSTLNYTEGFLKSATANKEFKDRDPYAELRLARAFARFRQSTYPKDLIALIEASKIKIDDRLLLMIGATRHVIGDSAGAADAVRYFDNKVRETTDIGSLEGGYAEGILTPICESLTLIHQYVPESDQVARLTGYLINRRSGRFWVSTRDTASVIYALSEITAGTATANLSLELNGRVVKEATGTLRMTLPITELTEGGNTLTIRQPGGNLVYCTMLAVQTPEKATEPATYKGLTIKQSVHVMQALRDSNGDLRLLGAPVANTVFKSGEPVKMRVEITSAEQMSYGMVRIPLPSNFMATDGGESDWWNWWFNGIQVFDDHVALFADRLEKGKNTFEINLRAEKPGSAMVIPATFELMYDPKVRASADYLRLEVTP